MKINFITNCTNRKRLAPKKELRGQALPAGSLIDVATEWNRRRLGTIEGVSAAELYCGRSFQEALGISARHGTNLWIISAGLGLVSAGQIVPPYSLTIANRADDSVAPKVTSGGYSSSAWWYHLNQDSVVAPIANLLNHSPNTLTIIAAPEPYIEMVKDDLLSCDKAVLQNLRIIGPRSPKKLGSRLGAYLMPYDERFDGPDSPLPGTRVDFPQRTSRHFVDVVVPDLAGAAASVHAKKVVQTMSQMAPPPVFNRTKKTDEEVISIIIDNWDQVPNSGSKMLRVLRDDLNVACEQGRFSRLYKKATARLAI